MTASSFDFSHYVQKRHRGEVGGDQGARYAYSADIAMLRTFRRMKPIELAASSIVRSAKEMMRNQYSGTTIRVTEKQIPRIHRIAKECADTLGVQMPAIYVANSPVINAYTFGTDDDSIIVVHAALVDHFTEQELKFVIGHEMGHIQNRHVVYGTILRLLRGGVGLLLKWILPPAEVALAAWARRAEITCDRAGLLCAQDLEVACNSFMKLACGSHKLYDELDLDEYLKQLEDARSGPGRFQEALASHPYLPKRIEALRVFAESELYRTAAGLGAGGISIEEVDERTSNLIQIVHEPRPDSATPDADARPAEPGEEHDQNGKETKH